MSSGMQTAAVSEAPVTGPGTLSTKVLGENHRVCWEGATHSSTRPQGDQPGLPGYLPGEPAAGAYVPPAPRLLSLLPESLLSA